jgi:hypothetical protein
LSFAAGAAMTIGCCTELGYHAFNAKQTSSWPLNATCALQLYYGAAIILHYIVPALLPVKSVQKGQRREGQVASEAVNSLGEHGTCS